MRGSACYPSPQLYSLSICKYKEHELYISMQAFENISALGSKLI